MTFEQRLARLDAIVGQLEREGADLAQSLALFEEGVELLRAASSDLANAEATVHRLVERADGSFDVVDRRE